MDDHLVDLTGTIALVAGATRGAGRGIAVELGAAGGTGVAVPCDHLDLRTVCARCGSRSTPSWSPRTTRCGC